jgi:hypothetical protein
MLVLGVLYWPTPGLAQTEIEIPMEGETPVDLFDASKEDHGIKIRGFVVGSFAYNQRIQMVPEFAGGVPKLAEPGQSNFGFNKFGLAISKTFAPWLYAFGTFEVENHNDAHSHGFNEPVTGGAGFGCPPPGTVPCTERFGAEEPETVVVLDRFALTVVAPIGNGIAFSLGRFDVPFGIERHDEPLLLTATTSDIFRFARPNFMTGLRGMYQFNPMVDLDLWVVNGWESETLHDDSNDNNGAKSYGGRIGLTPFPATSALNFGVGGWYGAEQDDNGGNKRWIVDVDATWTPFSDLLFNAEFVRGAEGGVTLRERGIPFPEPAITNEHVDWWALNFLTHYDAFEWLGLSLRYGYFVDADGARTGVTQKLQNITFAPIVHLSKLIPDLGGSGATYPRTRHPIEWVDLKIEGRYNFSDKDVFSSSDPAVPITDAYGSAWQMVVQAVVNF